jgi:recombination protein RecR
MLPIAIQDLAEKFRNFPGIGVRSSQKLALDVLQMKKVDFEALKKSLEETRQKVRFCHICGFFAQNKQEENFICDICQNNLRHNWQICLVEKPTDILSMEKSQIYRGKYHVLQKLISPLDNIFPQNTNLESLIEKRINNFIQTTFKSSSNESKKPLELILFFKAGFSGEATTAYIKETINQKGWQKYVLISRLAQGLPLYFNPETLDQATMVKALEDRKEI